MSKRRNKNPKVSTVITTDDYTFLLHVARALGFDLERIPRPGTGKSPVWRIYRKHKDWTARYSTPVLHKFEMRSEVARFLLDRVPLTVSELHPEVLARLHTYLEQ